MGNSRKLNAVRHYSSDDSREMNQVYAIGVEWTISMVKDYRLDYESKTDEWRRYKCEEFSDITVLFDMKDAHESYFDRQMFQIKTCLIYIQK